MKKWKNCEKIDFLRKMWKNGKIGKKSIFWEKCEKMEKLEKMAKKCQNRQNWPFWDFLGKILNFGRNHIFYSIGGSSDPKNTTFNLAPDFFRKIFFWNFLNQKT